MRQEDGESLPSPLPVVPNIVTVARSILPECICRLIDYQCA